MILLFGIFLAFAGIAFLLMSVFCVWILFSGARAGPIVHVLSADFSTRGVIAFLALTVLASIASFVGLHFLWKKADIRPSAG